ncbi:hypothetical protein ABGB18_48125 [Nonomuraea sp. B12E4]|uniref:hypothetical protein n=1 Tax=Nonomuraea sp. B12E4 TaxID=3153564 RepID=UPI00325F6A8F
MITSRSLCQSQISWPPAWIRLAAHLEKFLTVTFLKRINTYLVRWARRKFKRLRSFKKAQQWWTGLLQRQPTLFAHWAYMTEF